MMLHTLDDEVWLSWNLFWPLPSSVCVCVSALVSFSLKMNLETVFE